MISDLYRRFSRDALFSAGANFAVTFQGIILLPLLTKTIPVADYGAWVQVGITVGLMVILAVVSLDQAVIRFIAARTEPDEVRGAMLATLLIATLAALVPCLIMVGASDYLAEHWLREPVGAPLLRLGGAIVVAGTIERFCLIYFRTRHQIATYSLFYTAEFYTQLAATAVLLWLGFGVVGAALGMLIGKSAVVLAAGGLALTQVGAGRPDLSVLPGYFRFGLPLIPTSLFIWLINLVDRYIVNYFGDAASVGIYAVAYNVGFLTSLFFAPFFLIFVPTASRLWEEGRAPEVRALIEHSLKYLLYLSLPTIIGVSIVSRQLIRTFSTEAYVPGWLVVPIVALAYLGFHLADVHGTILTLGQRTGVLAYVYAASAALNIVLNLLLVPRLGIIGAAIATLATFTVLPLMLAPFAAPFVSFSLDWPALGRAVLASAVMGACIWKIDPPRLPQMLATLPVAVVVYALTLLLLGGFERRELAFVRQLLTRAPSPESQVASQ